GSNGELPHFRGAPLTSRRPAMTRAVPSLFLLAVTVVGGIAAHERGGSAGGAGGRRGLAGERDAGGVMTPLGAARLLPPAGGKSLRFRMPERDQPSDEPTPPFSLTSTDGTGLALVAVQAR